jgi:hypothetical protein
LNVLVRDPGEGWTMPLDGRSRAVALEAVSADVVTELEDLSLSLVRLEGFEAAQPVERLEDLAARGARFALVRGERRLRGRVAWLLFELAGTGQVAVDRRTPGAWPEQHQRSASGVSLAAPDTRAGIA